MTKMSAAALPPIQPRIERKDEAHPLFPLYRQHYNFCSNSLIRASAFRDWLHQYEQQLLSESAARDPDYPDFLDWMRANKGGRRECPVGCFPHNFRYWQQGGVW